MAERTWIRTLRADELERYRDLRLAALDDSPGAFTATAADERAMPDGAWSARVESTVAGSTTIVVADSGEGLVGLAGGIPWGARARVVSVWVAPAWRRAGIAARLVERVCEWARLAGYEEVQIETAPGNAAARRLYERLGFAPVDEDPLPHCGPTLVRRLISPAWLPPREPTPAPRSRRRPAAAPIGRGDPDVGAAVRPRDS